MPVRLRPGKPSPMRALGEGDKADRGQGWGRDRQADGKGGRQADGEEGR